jgi:hypothetical protein
MNYPLLSHEDFLLQPIDMLLILGGGVVAVQANLIYERYDPEAFTITFEPDLESEPAPCWKVARDLLSDGLYQPTGEGDAHFRPLRVGHVLMRLESPAGKVTGLIPREPLSHILGASRVMVSDKEAAEMRHEAAEMAALHLELLN